jgi:ribosomal protein S12 methylthiotransferase accessory factor
MQIRLDSSLSYMDGTYRVLDEQTTLSRIEAVQPKVGITRVARITDLDRVGIPVHSVIRPTAAKGAISVYSGKGASDDQSRISAVMEGVERCLAEAPRNNADIQEPHGEEENIIDSYLNLKERENALNPNELILPAPLPLNTPLEWMWGYDLLNKEEILIPANAVYHPYEPPSGSYRLFRSDTNGLAAGNCIEEAVLHGLLEVVERDAYSIAEYTRNTGKKIMLTPDDGTPYELYKKFTDAGVDVHLWQLPSDNGIHTVLAAVDDTVLKDPALLVIGSGAHLDPAVAVNRALTEAAQSRLVQIHGARENTDREAIMRRAGYESIKQINRHWYNQKTETVTLCELENQARRKPHDNIKEVLENITLTAKHAIIVNLSRPSIDIPVIRTIIPTYEVCALDSTRFGPRVREAMKQRGRSRWKRRKP